MSGRDTIKVQGVEVAYYEGEAHGDYISLTDIARYKSDVPKDVVKNWLRTHDVVEFLGLWEKLHNPRFKGVEFDSFKALAGSNSFTLSPRQWIERTGAIGIVSRSGRGGGTFAHTDIAFEFASWISPEFKLYLITDYQRLKRVEQRTTPLQWSVTRELAKINYRLQTDAVKNCLVPDELDERHRSMVYANEADVLNVALFGCTASEWRERFPESPGNMRDHASLLQLIVLSNLESYNAEMIKRGFDQAYRLDALNRAAREQLMLLLRYESEGAFGDDRSLGGGSGD